MKIVPVGERVVVKPLDAEEQSAGGIVLPDTARQRPQQGRVLSVGDGRLLSNGHRARQQVWEGDRVVFEAYSGTPVTVEGTELLILREDEILAVLP